MRFALCSLLDLFKHSSESKLKGVLFCFGFVLSCRVSFGLGGMFYHESSQGRVGSECFALLYFFNLIFLILLVLYKLSEMAYILDVTGL